MGNNNPESAFAVALGGGLYLDSNGEIVYTVTPSTLVYPMPELLHYDAKRAAESLKKFSEVVSYFAESKKTKEAWKVFGASTDVLKSLSQLDTLAAVAAGAATATATTLVYVAVGATGAGAVLAVIAALLSFVINKDDLSPALKNQFQALKNQLQAAEDIQRIDKIIEMQSKFSGSMDTMRVRLQQKDIHLPPAQTRKRLHEELVGIVDGLAAAIDEVQKAGWFTSYKLDEYHARFRLALTGHLFFNNEQGQPVLVPAAHNDSKRLDYRLAVPLLIYAATTYVTILRVAMPWVRSSGLYAPILRKFASAIDSFVVRMQAECIARTRYTADLVVKHRMQPPHSWPGYPFDEDGYYERGGKTAISVGAFDLVRYTDAFLSAQFAEHNPFGPDRGRRGLFNYTWLPPVDPSAPEAKEFEPYSGNPQKVAELANAQAEQDYSDLLASTGAFQLIRTANSLRCLATPPLHSETVSGRVINSRNFVTEGTTVARSPQIPFADVVEMPARLKRYEARSRLSITTQPPGYRPEFRYRVVLRTIASRVGKDGWGGRDYNGWVWQAHYDNDPANPVKTVKATFNKNLVMREYMLHEGISPMEPLTRPAGGVTGKLHLRASTFDWYVPLDIADLPFVEAGGEATNVLDAVLPPPPLPKVPGLQESPYGAGAVSIHLATKYATMNTKEQPGLGETPIAGKVDEFWSENVAGPDSMSLKHAERRNVREEDVELDWSLTWQEGHLAVRLSGRPDQRPFQVFVVVEEGVFSGAQHQTSAGPTDPALLRAHVHTAFAAEIVNQLVIVPVAFFAKEQLALDEARQRWEEIKGAVFKDASAYDTAGVHESMARMLNDLKARERRSPSTAVLADSYRERFDFIARERPHLFETLVAQRSRRPEGAVELATTERPRMREEWLGTSAEERAAVAAAIETLPADHPARRAFAEGVDTIALTHLVSGYPEVRDALCAAHIKASSRLIQRRGFTPWLGRDGGSAVG